jgi:hypothetical protein
MHTTTAKWQVDPAKRHENKISERTPFMSVEHPDLLHVSFRNCSQLENCRLIGRRIVVRITDVESLSVGEPLTEIGLREGLSGYSPRRDSSC